jgi:glycosyltransferase involved in cell wall biosynthesis
MHRIVFLHSEWSSYFGACTAALAAHPEVASVHVIHWEPSAEAPFSPPEVAGVVHHRKSTLPRQALEHLLTGIQPTALVVSGWMEGDYLAVARHWRKTIPVILCMDNRWRGTVRQHIAARTAPIHLRRSFDRIWIPGTPQLEFAERLGFPQQRIAMGLYCADSHVFSGAAATRMNPDFLPKPRLVYIGRYAPEKGIAELQDAFASVADAFPDWQLHCIGTGALWATRNQHSRTFHHGFLQQDAIHRVIRDAAVFVMPSVTEPWGVVLHEMACAGLPLSATPDVGASAAFLEPGINGTFLDRHNLAHELAQVMQVSLTERAAQGRASHRIGMSYTPALWTLRLLDLIQTP